MIHSFRKIALLGCLVSASFSQSKTDNPTAGNQPIIRALWKMEAVYPTPYAPAQSEAIKAKLDQILTFLDLASPIRLTDEKGFPIKRSDEARLPQLTEGPFRILSYEFGVIYDGMLQTYQQTGDKSYLDFVNSRINTLADLGRIYGNIPKAKRPTKYPSKWLLEPVYLDHCGAMGSALIKAKQISSTLDIEHLVAPAMECVSHRQHRLPSGLLARNHPFPDSLWLDDLYMSVPLLARKGLESGDEAYFDDACLQIIEMANRLFLPEKKLFRHSWIKGMEPQLDFAWGRANGWAIMAMAELLSVLPENHPQRGKIIKLFRDHAEGIIKSQNINGMWSQLLDRSDTYDETSASAIFVYALARGINRGWLDPISYGPGVSLGWNAISEKVDLSGQINDICIATGIGWDPAYYAFRPTSPYAEHGYGPLLLAGSEMLALLKNKDVHIVHKNHAVEFKAKNR